MAGLALNTLQTRVGAAGGAGLGARGGQTPRAMPMAPARRPEAPVRTPLPTTPYEETTARYDPTANRYLHDTKMVDPDPLMHSAAIREAEARAKIAEQEANRTPLTLDQLMAKFNATAGGGGSVAAVPAPEVASGPDLSARLHDRVALQNQGALRTLQKQLGASSLADNVGLRSRGMADILAGGSNALTEGETAILQDEAARKDAAAMAGYSGAIAQRGQDISANQTRLNALLDLVRSSGGRIY